MSKLNLTTSLLYRHRYAIGYGIIIILLVGLLLVAGLLIPGSLTESEHASIVASHSLSFSQLWHDAPLNAPLLLLQHATLSLFGPTLLGIKLPALLLGFATAIGMALLLRRWFTPGIAVLAAMIAVTTGQFLFLAQQGSSGILYLFWPTMLLLLGTLIAKHARHRLLWKILFAVTAALSLYTPLSFYVLAALGSAVLLHPHLRYIIVRLPRLKILGGVFVALLLLTPLVLTIIREPHTLLVLLGIPDTWPNLLNNLSELAGQYFSFLTLGDKSIMLPVFGLGSMLIILFGLYRLIRSRETVQSYIILAWIIMLLPVLIINPTFTSIMFVPLFLMLATGLEGILRSWYGIFPKNPYARIAGLIPLIVLVSSMMLFGLERYGYGYRYSPDTVRTFSRDVLLLPETPRLVVTPEEQPLYEAVVDYGNKDTVITTTQPLSGEFTVTTAAHKKGLTPTTVITDGRASDAARFYIYK